MYTSQTLQSLRVHHQPLLCCFLVTCLKVLAIVNRMLLPIWTVLFLNIGLQADTDIIRPKLSDTSPESSTTAVGGAHAKTAKFGWCTYKHSLQLLPYPEGVTSTRD